MKLAGDSDDLLAIFRELGGVDTVSSEVLSTYYDTVDGRLWRKGFTFRLRARRGQDELTLKKEKGFVRREWTSRIDEPVASIARLPQQAPHGDLGLGSSGLVPLFASNVRRRQTRLEANGALIEVSIDAGRIFAGERHTRVSELEFELVGGPVQDMLHCIRALLSGRRLSAHTCSKAARGMAMVNDAMSACSKAPKLQLHRADTVDDAVRLIIAGVATHILENISFATDGRDPEGVHQLRVALRRFRSTIRLFRAYLDPRAFSLEEEARLALRRLGRVRDLDVLISETIPRALKDSDSDHDFEVLLDIAREQIVDARSDVRRLVVDPRFNSFLIDLLIIWQCGDLVKHYRDTPLGRVATPLLRKYHGKLLKTGKNFAKLTGRQRHKVRIALKKLRYACDIFRTLYPGESTNVYIGKLADLQKHLGRFNDVIVAERMIADLCAGEGKTAINAEHVRDIYKIRLHALEPRLVRKWKRIAQTEPFWQ